MAPSPFPGPSRQHHAEAAALRLSLRAPSAHTGAPSPQILASCSSHIRSSRLTDQTSRPIRSSNCFYLLGIKIRASWCLLPVAWEAILLAVRVIYSFSCGLCTGQAGGFLIHRFVLSDDQIMHHTDDIRVQV